MVNGDFEKGFETKNSFVASARGSRVLRGDPIKHSDIVVSRAIKRRIQSKSHSPGQFGKFTRITSAHSPNSLSPTVEKRGEPSHGYEFMGGPLDNPRSMLELSNHPIPGRDAELLESNGANRWKLRWATL